MTFNSKYFQSAGNMHAFIPLILYICSYVSEANDTPHPCFDASITVCMSGEKAHTALCKSSGYVQTTDSKHFVFYCIRLKRVSSSQILSVILACVCARLHVCMRAHVRAFLCKSHPRCTKRTTAFFLPNSRVHCVCDLVSAEETVTWWTVSMRQPIIIHNRDNRASAIVALLLCK